VLRLGSPLMLRHAKSEPGKDAGSVNTGLEVLARPRTQHGDVLQPPERKTTFGTEH
jgi:hypothetical protein